MFKKIKIYLSAHRWLNLLLQLLLFVLIFLAITTWQTRNSARGNAPEFTAHLLDNSPVSLHTYRGKPLLLHFWATWCPVCKLEQSSISNLAEAGMENNYQVVTVASWSGNAGEVTQFMQQEGLHFPVIVDNDGSLAKTYGVDGVPTSFLIDAQGVISFVERGYTTEAGLRLRLWWLKNN